MIPIKSFNHKKKYLAKNAAMHKDATLVKNFKMPVIAYINQKNDKNRKK